jgi:methylenetetrahydrofolate reductase (NADPH)
VPISDEKRARGLGIRNLLALRGGVFSLPRWFEACCLIRRDDLDPPRGDEYWVATDDQFQHAADLVRYIRRTHGDYFCVGVAGQIGEAVSCAGLAEFLARLGYPEGHTDSQDKIVDLDYLKEKIDAGAEFVVTQLFYDTDLFLGWLSECRRRGKWDMPLTATQKRAHRSPYCFSFCTGINVPILPGIMPIQNYQSFRRMTNLCKTLIPPSVAPRLDPIRVRPVQAHSIEACAWC